MNQRSLLLAILALVVIAVAVFYQTKPQPVPARLVLIGTNSISIGAHLYDPHSWRPLGEVLNIRNAHEFPDGTIRPAVLTRAENGAVVWTPREALDKALVAQ